VRQSPETRVFYLFIKKDLIFLQDLKGDENYHLFAQPVIGGPARNLSPFNNTRVDQTLYSHNLPDEVGKTLFP
jgi:hypothetical protein